MRRLTLVLGLLLLISGAWAMPVQGQEELPLGSSLPSVEGTLERVEGGTVSLSDLTGETATVFLFWSNQCPWVDKYESRVQEIVQEFQGQGIRFVRVNSNDATAFPQESLQASQERAADQGYASPYVKDRDAALARALGASRTPHVFVFDGSNTLVYAGTIDDSPGDAENVQKPYLRDALRALAAGTEIPVADTKAFGCTIKLPN